MNLRESFYEPYSNLSKTLVLDIAIVYETTLSVSHTVYKYIVVHVWMLTK